MTKEKEKEGGTREGGREGRKGWGSGRKEGGREDGG